MHYRKVYVFVGPEKTGTTTIFDLLPFARRQVQKERFFLSRHSDLKAEVMRIEAQLAVQEAAFIVEPTYFVSAFARSALAGLSDRYDIHIVHTRRDPIERMISHYIHHKAKGRVSEPGAAVAVFPEIIESSRYETYSELWKEAFPKFSIIDIQSGTDLSTAIATLGIITHCHNEVLRSNQRLAPRYLGLARMASLLWQSLLVLGLNRLVPASLKNQIKRQVYYGGKQVVASGDERECLIRMFLTTD